MTTEKKGTIMSHRTNATIDTLRNEGFKVVGIRTVKTTDPWRFVIRWKEADLAKGKIACHLLYEDGEELPAVEEETPYKVVEGDSSRILTLEDLLALPEETVEERKERERQEIIDARHVAYDGTMIYIVPVGVKSFWPPEENAIVCKPTGYQTMDGDRYYKVSGMNKEQSQRISSESEGSSGANGEDGLWIKTTEAHLEAIVRKLTA